MSSTQSSDANERYYDASGIPMRKMPWFTKSLWVLALLMLVGIVYSFWRISNVATPTLDLPPTSSDPVHGR